jgi:hypothetical protein
MDTTLTAPVKQNKILKMPAAWCGYLTTGHSGSLDHEEREEAANEVRRIRRHHKCDRQPYVFTVVQSILPATMKYDYPQGQSGEALHYNFHFTPKTA